MKRAWAEPLSRPTSTKRKSERTKVMLPARLSWKDQHGAARFASVVTRDVSETGVFVECQSPISITRFRLVQFQLERDVRDADGLPDSIRQGRLLSAVYRIVPPTRSGGRQGLALRLLVDPRKLHQPEVGRATSLELVATVASVRDHASATA